LNIVLVAKSSSGKDLAYSHIKENYNVNPLCSLTTRPMRESETNGKEYYFVAKEYFLDEIKYNNLLEHRTYNVDFDGKKETWYYGTSKKFISDEDNILILDFDGLKSITDIYGKENVYSIYIDVDDDIRELRAKTRGSFCKAEWDRRLIDDNIKFTKERINDCDIIIRNNTDKEDFIKNIDVVIKNIVSEKDI